MIDLQKLLECVEAASGADRELDCRIEAALVHKAALSVVGAPTYGSPRFFCNPLPSTDWIGYDLLLTAPIYTASLDASIALCGKLIEDALIGASRTGTPARFRYDEEDIGFDNDIPGGEETPRWNAWCYGESAQHPTSPAIALCAALLKALIALRSSPPVGRTDASQSKVEGETKQKPNPPLKGEGPAST